MVTRARAMPIRDLVLAVAVVAIWGFNFVVIKVGVADVPPLLLTALRFLFVAPFVFLVPPPRTRARHVVAFGLTLGVVKFGLLFVGIKAGMPAGLSSLILQIQAFFTIGLAFLVLGERPAPLQIAGGVVALLGVGVIAAGQPSAALLPFLLVVAAAFFWGVANIVAKRAGPVDMLSFIVWASLVPPLPLIALSLAFEGPQAIAAAITAPTLTGFGAVLYLAFPSTVFGFAVWNRLMGTYKAATIAPFSLLVPVFGIAGGALVLGERIGPAVIAGAALIVAGLAGTVFGARRPG